MALQHQPARTSTIDVLDRVLDKGIVIDAWLRVSVAGINLITLQARVLVASIETYLRHGEAVAQIEPNSLFTELPGSIQRTSTPDG